MVLLGRTRRALAKIPTRGVHGLILKRLLMLIPILLIVTAGTFTLLHLAPGDMASTLAGPMATEEQIERIAEYYHLRDPIPVQYFSWLGNLVRGDFGRSITTHRPVLGEILSRLPATLILMVTAFLVSIAIAIPMGVIAALKRKTKVDYGTMGVALFGVSIPNFWQGLMAIWIFAILLGWFPISGAEKGVWSLVLPALTLGTALAGSTARLTRSAMLDVLRQDYIRTARAKGLSERTVVYTHALKNAFIPVTTVLFLRIPFLFSGSVIIERVFGWPGIGSLMIDSILTRPDPPMILGILLMFTFMTVIANMLCDVTYAYLDPRVRYR